MVRWVVDLSTDCYMVQNALAETALPLLADRTFAPSHRDQKARASAPSEAELLDCEASVANVARLDEGDQALGTYESTDAVDTVEASIIEKELQVVQRSESYRTGRARSRRLEAARSGPRPRWRPTAESPDSAELHRSYGKIPVSKLRDPRRSVEWAR